MTIGEALTWTVEKLKRAGMEETRMEARLLVAHVMDISPETVFSFPERVLADEAWRRLGQAVERRCGREPMAHITGQREFWSLPMAVNSHTLIPRPDSETLIEAVLDTFERPDDERTILDLGTGSGCLLLALLHERDRWTGTGIDSSAAALDVAMANGLALGLAHRSDFVRFNWSRQPLSSLGVKKFDLVIANPPYIAIGDLAGLEPEVAGFEPLSALLAGDEGLNDYQIIVPQLASVLAPEGRVFLEVGKGQAERVGAMLGEHGFTGIGRKADLAGISRCVFGQLKK